MWCDESSCKSSCLFALLTTCYELLEEIHGSQESLSSRLETPFVIVCELSPEPKYFWLTSELWLFLFSSSFPSACLHLKGSGDSQPNFRQLKQTFFFFSITFQAFWSLKHSRRARLMQTKSTFANLAFILNVSKRAVRMRSVAHSTSELAEMWWCDSSHLTIETGMGVGFSEQKTTEKLNCPG